LSRHYHPATFSDGILEFVVRKHLIPLGTVLDPFAGVGRIHELRNDLRDTVGIEIEQPWANARRGTIRGNAKYLPFPNDRFDGVFTSPCLAQQHRVLTDDLRWVPVGNIVVGDRLLAFDEQGTPGATGCNSRRRWRRAEVVRSIPRKVQCLRVILANGDEVITTPEHPWLVSRYSYGGCAMEWVPSSRLARFYASLQVEPWEPLRSYDAGWLAGMFDGEGSLSLGTHGSPKMTLYQVQGPIIDRAENLMYRFGYEPNRIPRKNQPPHRQPVDNLYVTGGFPGILRALGELRPTRLLEKWASLDISTRTVEAERVPVLSVESAGTMDIQEIETDTGTYIGEGYLHHNCYGNRMADHHVAKDGSSRRSYTHDLQRTTGDPTRQLHPENAGKMFAWQPAYWELHEAAWREVHRVLKPSTPERTFPFVLNVSDCIRNGKVFPVVAKHRELCQNVGFMVLQHHEIPTPRLRHGQNHEARVPTEAVIVFKKGS
jgi:hypothetical protein